MVDPRYTHMSLLADYNAPIRPSADIAVLVTLINWIITHDQAQRKYVRNFTSAAFIVKE